MEVRDDPRYVVAGAITRPWPLHPARHPTETLAEFTRFDEPGWVEYLTDFRIDELGGGYARPSTQTRGRSTDAGAGRSAHPVLVGDPPGQWTHPTRRPGRGRPAGAKGAVTHAVTAS